MPPSTVQRQHLGRRLRGSHGPPVGSVAHEAYGTAQGLPRGRRYTAEPARPLRTSTPVTRLNAATIDFDEPAWRLEQRRGSARARSETSGLPDPAEEVWRYAPVDKLADRRARARRARRRRRDRDGHRRSDARRGRHRPRGRARRRWRRPEPWTDSRWPRSRRPEGLGELIGADDAFAALNLALTPAPVVIEVRRARRSTDPSCCWSTARPGVVVPPRAGASGRRRESAHPRARHRRRRGPRRGRRRVRRAATARVSRCAPCSLSGAPRGRCCAPARGSAGTPSFSQTVAGLGAPLRPGARRRAARRRRLHLHAAHRARRHRRPGPRPAHACRTTWARRTTSQAAVQGRGGGLVALDLQRSRPDAPRRASAQTRAR